MKVQRKQLGRSVCIHPRCVSGQGSRGPDPAGAAARRSVVRCACAGSVDRRRVHDGRGEPAVVAHTGVAAAIVEQADSRRDSAPDCRRLGRAADSCPGGRSSPFAGWPAHSVRQLHLGGPRTPSRQRRTCTRDTTSRVWGRTALGGCTRYLSIRQARRQRVHSAYGSTWRRERLERPTPGECIAGGQALRGRTDHSESSQQ